MSTIDLRIHEDRLELFEAWFDQEMPGKSAKWETVTFAKVAGSYAVLYTVRITSRSEKTLKLVQDTWGVVGATPS